jgi:hypothetical protein
MDPIQTSNHIKELLAQHPTADAKHVRELLAKPGMIKLFCLPNALMTFTEYLED